MAQLSRTTLPPSFWTFLGNDFDLHQILQNRPPFQRTGLTVCQYLDKIREIQDGFNYQEDGIGATMAAYLGVSACIMFTNLFTLVIFYHATNLRRPRNYLVTMHMITDCFQSAITMPITLLMTFHLFWAAFDDFGCKLASFLKAASFYASYLSLSVLAAHQYISYHFKFSSHWFCLILFVASIFALPYVLSVSADVVNYFEPWNDSEHLDHALSECNMIRPMICSESGWSRVPLMSQEGYLIMTLVLLYVLPISGLFLSYRASKQMSQSLALLPASCGTPMKNKENLMMLTFLVFIFLIFWLPMTVFTFLHLFDLIQFTYNRYLICQTIGVSSGIIKPIVYGLTNKAIRQMYQDTIRSVFCLCGLCARPQRSNLRRLIRMGMGLTEIPRTEDEPENLEREARNKRPKRRYNRAVTITGGSLVDRRLVHNFNSPRRTHYSLR